MSDLLCVKLYHKVRLCRRQHQLVVGRGLRAFEEHRRILEAIEDGDGVLAEYLMRRHVAVARHELEGLLVPKTELTVNSEESVIIGG